MFPNPWKSEASDSSSSWTPMQWIPLRNIGVPLPLPNTRAVITNFNNSSEFFVLINFNSSFNNFSLCAKYSTFTSKNSEFSVFLPLNSTNLQWIFGMDSFSGTSIIGSALHLNSSAGSFNSIKYLWFTWRKPRWTTILSPDFWYVTLFSLSNSSFNVVVSKWTWCSEKKDEKIVNSVNGAVMSSVNYKIFAFSYQL